MWRIKSQRSHFPSQFWHLLWIFIDAHDLYMSDDMYRIDWTTVWMCRCFEYSSKHVSMTSNCMIASCLVIFVSTNPSDSPFFKGKTFFGSGEKEQPYWWQRQWYTVGDQTGAFSSKNEYTGSHFCYMTRCAFQTYWKQLCQSDLLSMTKRDLNTKERLWRFFFRDISCSTRRVEKSPQMPLVKRGHVNVMQTYRFILLPREDFNAVCDYRKWHNRESLDGIS